jgi:hypothetical protein
MKTTLTRESIIKAINDGAKSLTKVAHAHGYKGSVSSGTAKTIRNIVPEIADLFAGKEVKVEAPVEKPVVAAVTAPVTAPDVKPPVVQVIKQRVEAARTDGTPYRGKVYGTVFAEAVAVGNIGVRQFVVQTAAKLGLTELQVFTATQVMRNPNHQTNKSRSRDVADQRGFMQIEAIVAVAEGAEVAE